MQPNPPDAQLAPKLEAFRAHLLARGFAATTAKAYVCTVRGWLAGTHALDAGKRGSASVLRGALAAWGAWTGEEVPEVRLPPPPPVRRAPGGAAGPTDLAAYHRAVEWCSDPAVRAVLHVLPEAGVRLGELLRSPRRGPEPWRRSAWLADYVVFLDPGPWLFPGPDGAPLSTGAVQRALRVLRGSRGWSTDGVRRGDLEGRRGQPLDPGFR